MWTEIQVMRERHSVVLHAWWVSKLTWVENKHDSLFGSFSYHVDLGVVVTAFTCMDFWCGYFCLLLETQPHHTTVA